MKRPKNLKATDSSLSLRMTRCAFTLAEVLITLVIIGVIAALTIPNLMQKYQEQTTVKKVQKFYSNMSNAYSLAKKENGPADEWGLTGNNETSAIKIYEILFKPYFKIAKNCGINNTGNCIANLRYKYLNNIRTINYAANTVTANNEKYYKITLEEGSAVWFRGSIVDTYEMAIFYDVNGIKGPNQWGIDLFSFAIQNNKIIPTGLSVSPFQTYCKKTAYGWGCAAWVIYKGNMDYLHCDGLTWNSKSCKDK